VTVWSILEECVGLLDEPFRRSEIIGWFRRHHPEVKETTLAAHIQAATANATNRERNNALGGRPPLLRRVDHGLYVRATAPEPEPVPEPESAPEPHGVDVILIGCVRTKRAVPSAAAELFAGPLFERRRRYAVAGGLPWYILSAKFGLLAPGDVIGPYDLYLADQSPDYQKAWGEFVTARLEALEPGLRGRTVEVHAGAVYVNPLRRPLTGRGAALVAPLAHLRQGEQLAWYGGHVVPATRTRTPGAAEPARSLADPAQAISPAELTRRGRARLSGPGLYSWWVDEPGAADLSLGLGLPIPAGLIYAGQAGATRRPSGRRSTNTLWGRISGMHLGGSAEFSTFRRSLAAILRGVLGLDTEDDPRLSDWINAHLRVVTLEVPDADRLGEIESAVLDILDPPLNLRGRPVSAIRTRLTGLRRGDGGGPAVA
jgi:hypothetical protein